MKIALIGASGFVGSAILQEAVSRGHQVTAIVRDISKVAAHPQVRAVAVDAQDSQALAQVLAGHDRVISAYNPGWTVPDIYDQYLKGASAIVAAAKATSSWLLVVGGAGSLEVSPGVQLMDTPAFPAAWQATAEGARQALKRLQQETQLDWTMLSPAAQLEPGARTGSFRLGGDKLLADAEGHSRISVQDYAVAMIDELERPAHSRRRFSVAY